MKKLVIFDLDGTLLNSVYAISNAANKALKKLNLKTYPSEEYYNFVGGGLKELVDRIIKKEGYNIKNEEILNKLLEIYNKEYDYMLDIYDGIDYFLNFLEEKKIKFAIITNKNTDLAKKSVYKTILNKYKFVDIIGLEKEKIEEKKPNPVNVNRLIEKFGLKKEEVLFIGDMKVDIETAKNSNIDIAYCNWGFGNKINENVELKIIFNNVYEIIDRYWVKNENK